MSTIPFPIFKVRKVKRWSTEEDQQIKSMIEKSKRKNWKSLVGGMKRKSIMDCMARYKSTCFKKGRWTLEEDRKLFGYYEFLGRNWAVISNLMKTRNSKQVKDRFNNHLDPLISNEPFSFQEDLLILNLYKIFNTKWKLYIDHLPARSADRIKTRYNSSIKSKINKI